MRYLKEDEVNYWKERSCLVEMIGKTFKATEQSDYDAVELALLDALRSNRELKRITAKKQDHDRLNEFVNQMNIRSLMILQVELSNE